jgi:hypothetical protein
MGGLPKGLCFKNIVNFLFIESNKLIIIF